jgi:hypothetical protein
MTKKELEPFLPKWRKDALTLKEFHALTKESKNDYIKSLMLIPDKEKGDVDIHILRFHTIEIKSDSRNFFTLEDIY